MALFVRFWVWLEEYFFAIGLFGVGLNPLWWGLVVVQWQGSVVSIGTGRPGVVAYANVG